MITLITNTPTDISTYTRGIKVIDHIMGSKDLIRFVEKSGYLPFYEGAWISDHRPAFVDLTLTINQQDIESKTNRNITSNHHKQVTHYLTNLQLSNQIDNITHSIQQLDDTQDWTPTTHNDLEEIDQQLTSLLVTTEQKLKSPPNSPWSPQLHEAYEIHRYWTIQKMRKHNKIKKTTTVLTLEAKYKDNLHQGNHNRSIYGQFYQSKQNLFKCRDQARKIRNEYLLSAYQEATIMADSKKMKILQNISKTESKNHRYKTFRNISKPSSGGLNHILVEEDNKIKRIDNKDDIETALQNHFSNHFDQATGTPFTKPPLNYMFGYSGVINSTQKLLDKQLYIPNQSPTMTTFLKQLTRSRPPIDHHFPTEQIIKGVQKWKEKTTTSPSGLHLGIYRSIIKGTSHTDTSYQNSNQPNRNNWQTNTIGHPGMPLLSTMATHTQFHYRKIPGYPIITKLRVIHIMEADWNLINKNFAGRQILHAAVNGSTTAHEQAGGRPDRRAIEEALQTTITYDICNLQQLTGGVSYNDAKSCYDRIPENLSNIAAMKQGLSDKVAELHATTLRIAKYHVKLKTIISTKFNQHSSTKQFHGVGQGAGDSASRWGFISDNIITTYNSTATDAIITSPTTLIQSNQKVQAFVDDVRNLAINPAHQLYAACQELTQKAQTWEKILYCASAKLELSKTSYFLFGWRYDGDGNHVIDNSYNKHHILKSETGNTFTLKNMSTTESYKLLGIHVPFTGPMTTHYNHLMEKCNSICTTINQLSLNPSNILLTIYTIAHPALTYSLPATTIKEKHLNLISNKLANSVLPKLGYNRRFQRAIALAPAKYGGLKLPDMYHSQGSSQIHITINHLNRTTSLLTAIIQMIESYHVRTGRLGSCLVDPRPCSYAQPQWLTNFLKYLQATKCTIQTTHIGTQEVIRQHDLSIMNELQTLSLTIKDLKIINNIRTFLQVTTIAEISNITGNKIHPAYSEKQSPTTRPIHHGMSLIKWPPQPPPPLRMWRVWLKHTQKLCKPTSWILKQPLGPWKTTHSQQRKWYGTISDNTVKIDNSYWRQHRQTHTQTIYTRSEPTQISRTTPFIPNDISDTYITADKCTQVDMIQTTTPIPQPILIDADPNQPTTTIKIAVTIGSHSTDTGGATSYEAIQPNKPKHNFSNTTPNMNKPSHLTLITIGIIQCIQQLQVPASCSIEMTIQTTTVISKQLKKQQPIINHYHQ